MSPIRMSKIEFAIRTVLEFNQAFNRHDVTGMMALHQLPDRFTVLDRWGVPVAAIGMSFVLLVYNPDAGAWRVCGI